jgi:two-component system NtrC family sensor kinase
VRLSEKLILFVLTAAIVPLTLVAFGLLRQSERELTRRITDQQRAVAAAAAEEIGAEIMSGVNALATSAAVIDWRKASPEEIEGGLKLLYAQSDLVAAVVLADATRQPELPGPVQDQEGRPVADDELPLVSSFPLDSLGARGERGQVAVLPVRFHGQDGSLRVAIQVGPRSPTSPFIVAELAMSPLAKKLIARASPSVGELELVESEDRVVVASEGVSGAPMKPGRVDVLRSAEGAGRSVDAERVAAAEVPGKLGLFVSVSLPEDVALAPVHALRRTILFGTLGTLAFLVLVAVAFTRRLNARLAKVGTAAEAYAKGELSTRIEVGGADELTDLANTFNRMGTELEAARAKLTRWNDELKQRVDEATADLRAAQTQLIEAQKLAAIGQLGAGVAHEINNPLCGILGNAQLLMLDRDPTGDEFDLLKKIEESAKRCRDITQNLLRFSQSQAAGSMRPTDLNAVVRSTLDFETVRMAEAKVIVDLQLSAGPLPVLGDPEQLSQVVAAMVSNARTAMAKAPFRRLSIRSRTTAAGVELVVNDTGKGIAPENMSRVFDPFFTTKDVWSNIGLGLSVAYRIMKEHDGRIDVESAVGKGATFTVRLPAFDPKRARGPAQTGGQPLNVGGQGVGIVR